MAFVNKKDFFVSNEISKEVKDEESLKLIWDKEKVDECYEQIVNGVKPKLSPFFDGNISWKRANLVYRYTDWEINEIRKCATDIIYFAETYCMLMTDKGYSKIELRPYQKKMLLAFQDNRFNIVLASRQIGKTTTTSIFISWYVCFQYDKEAFFLANKGATTSEVVTKTKNIMGNLPFFLKPGAHSLNVFSMSFDNGCKIHAQATTKNSAVGYTIHLLFLDEFAHVHHSFVKQFYENIYPTISASDISKIIITSTPKGFNTFYEIYTKAERGENQYNPIRVDWWEVPGRDDEWKRLQTANLGSEDAFNEQYGNQFLSVNSLLLDGADLKQLNTEKVKFENTEVYELNHLNYEKLYWHPNFDPNEIQENQFFILSIDLAEGGGGDYSVINIFKIYLIEKDYIKYLKDTTNLKDYFALWQVGVFYDNRTNLDKVTELVYALSYNVFNNENVKIIIEHNVYGDFFISKINSLYSDKNEFDMSLFVRYKHANYKKYKSVGLKLKSDNKNLICADFKVYVKNRRIKIFEEECVFQACNFGRNSKGNYEGQSGHDDLMMSCINASTIFNTMEFTDIIEEFFDCLTDEQQKHIESHLDKEINKNINYDFSLYEII